MTQYHNKVRGTKVAGAAVGGTVGGVIANKLAKKATNNMKSKAGKKAIRVVSTVAGIAAGGYGGYKAGGKIGKKIFKKPSYQSVHCDEQVMYSVGKRLKARARREYYGLKGMYGGSDASSRNRRNDLIATSAMGSIAGAAMGYGVTKKAKNKSAAAIKDRRRRVRKNVVIGALVGTAAGAGTAHALHRSDLGTLIGDRPSIGSFDLNTSVHRKLDFQDMVHKGRYGEKERLRRAGNRKGWKSGYSL